MQEEAIAKDTEAEERIVYCKIQEAFSGSEKQLRFPVDLSLTVFGMNTDSSDMETEEEAPRFPNAGKASLESMLESAVADRFASKKQSKALTLE